MCAGTDDGRRYIMRLGVNIDHVATLRQARGTNYPEPVSAAFLAELGGADQIVCHLREDRRHINDRDLQILRQTVHISLNMEMACTDQMVAIALNVRPDVVTLVPERREELTTEQGLDVVGRYQFLEPSVQQLKGAGIKVSLFIDPDLEQVKAAHKLGAAQIELHTGTYAEACGKNSYQTQYSRLVDSATLGAELGLEVAAGHGIDYQNVKPIVAISQIEELNIGHSIVSRAIYVGLEAAVREMVACMVPQPKR